VRALWLIPVGLAFSAVVNAGNDAVPEQQPAPAALARVGTPPRSANLPKGGNGRAVPNLQEKAHHDARPISGYGLPYYVQPEYPDSDDVDTGYVGSDDGQVYAQAPYEQPQDDVSAAPAAPTIQAAVSYVVQYVTSGQQQPVNVATNARITKGTLYKYTHDGVDTYTNMPPSSDVDAKTLFNYTEVDTPVARRSLYRCIDGKSKDVNYSITPIASMYCTEVGTGATAAN